MNSLRPGRLLAVRRAWGWLAVLLIGLCLVFSIPAQPAQADVTFTVNTATDSIDANAGNGACADSQGRCSLRAAVMEANALPGADTIILPQGTYTLTIANATPEGENLAAAGDLDVVDHLTILGNNGVDVYNPEITIDPERTIIQAGTNATNGIDKIFSVNPNHDTPVSFELRGLTVRYGYNRASAVLDGAVPNGNGWGGGMDWTASGNANLTIFKVRFQNNTAVNGGGGGIALFSNSGSGTADIEFFRVENNLVQNGSGGGIFVGPDVNADFRTGTVDSNRTSNGAQPAFGGGIFKLGSGAEPETIFEYLTVSRNQVTGMDAGGGGIFITGRAWIRGSTISGNSAAGYGGGIAINNPAGVLVRTNMLTITNNRANADNTGAETGGGVWTSPSADLLMYNSLVLGNFRGSGTTIDNLSCSLFGDSGHNLTDGPATHLGPLADNGGETFTHKLLPGSPALDAGDNNHRTGNDQRSRNRQVDSADEGREMTVDIGAYEARPTIQDIPNQVAVPGVQLIVPFRVNDTTVEPTTVTITRTDPDIYPDGSITISGPVDDVYTLRLTSAPGLTGTVRVTVRIANVQDFAEDSFLVTVGTDAFPDPRISKTHAGSFIQAQIGAQYTLTVTNSGGVPTSGTITVTDTVPAGLTPTAIGGEGWNCSLASRSCTRSDALHPGSDYPPITLTVTVAANAPASVTNTATVAGGGDNNPSNNTAADPTTILTQPDLSITKSHTGNFYRGQAGAQYTIRVRNGGGTPTTAPVSVTDALPAGLTANAISGPGWTCSLGSQTCTRADALAPDTSYPAITVTVNVSQSAPASVTNTAQVSGGGDANPNNNNASDQTVILTQQPPSNLLFLPLLRK